MIESVTEIRVRYCETDKMGIVHHSHYFNWFEVGRIHLLDTIGLSYRKLEALGYFLPLLHAQAEYKAPARFDDCVTLRTCMPEKPGARIRMICQMLRGDELLCRAETQHTFVNSRGQPVRPPAELLEKTMAFYS